MQRMNQRFIANILFIYLFSSFCILHFMCYGHVHFVRIVCKLYGALQIVQLCDAFNY